MHPVGRGSMWCHDHPPRTEPSRHANSGGNQAIPRPPGQGTPVAYGPGFCCASRMRSAETSTAAPTPSPPGVILQRIEHAPGLSTASLSECYDRALPHISRSLCTTLPVLFLAAHVRGGPSFLPISAWSTRLAHLSEHPGSLETYTCGSVLSDSSKPSSSCL